MTQHAANMLFKHRRCKDALTKPFLVAQQFIVRFAPTHARYAATGCESDYND